MMIAIQCCTCAALHAAITPPKQKETKMKVRKSTEDCAAYNKLNADMISIGMMEGWEPTDEVLRNEKEAAERDARDKARAEVGAAILQSIWNALPVETRALYAKPEGYKLTLGWGTNWQSLGRPEHVEVEYYRSGGYGSRNSYWRVVIGNYGNKRITQLSGDKLTLRQLENIVAKLKDAHTAARCKLDHEVAKEAAQKRRSAWLAVPECMELAKQITNSTYVSEYDANLNITAEGLISWKGNVFDAGQWRKIIALRNVHALEMKNLMDSYKQGEVIKA